MKTHILYVPGLGDGYDRLRTIAVRRWKKNGVTAEMVPMKWHDAHETYEQKIARLREKIEHASADRVVLVGESAGGSVVIAETLRIDSNVAKGITICGKNTRSDRVAPSVYLRNRAFRTSMRQADKVIKDHPERGDRVTVFYSSLDPIIHYVDTYIPNATMRRLPTFGHFFSIVAVLFFLKHRVISEAISNI